jgi:hypothetical protein
MIFGQVTCKSTENKNQIMFFSSISRFNIASFLSITCQSPNSVGMAQSQTHVRGAAFAERASLAVGFHDGVGEVHHARSPRTVPQTQSVSHLMHCLLHCTLQKQLPIFGGTVKFWLKTPKANQRGFSRALCLAKNEV